MNRLNTFIVSIFMLIAVLAVQAGSVQAGYLKVDIAAPDNTINTRTFNVEYTALSTDQNDKIAVKLWQNDQLIRSEFTSKDYGDSGGFSITVPADGTYTYYYTATVGSDTVKSDVKTVKVDATPTSSPSYSGVMRNGDTYTVKFKAPANSDVTEIRIFASISANFTADSATQIGVVKVTPGQEATFTYTAPDSRARYIAVQAFDSAGNGSDITGDPNTVVARGATSQTYQAGGSAGNGVEGANTSGNGQVNASGKSSTDINTNAADVLSDGTNKQGQSAPASDSWIAWAIIIALIVASLAYANRAKLAELYARIRPTKK